MRIKIVKRDDSRDGGGRATSETVAEARNEVNIGNINKFRNEVVGDFSWMPVMTYSDSLIFAALKKTVKLMHRYVGFTTAQVPRPRLLRRAKNLKRSRLILRRRRQSSWFYFGLSSVDMKRICHFLIICLMWITINDDQWRSTIRLLKTISKNCYWSALTRLKSFWDSLITTNPHTLLFCKYYSHPEKSEKSPLDYRT